MDASPDDDVATATHQQLAIELQPDGDRVAVSLAGELDIATVGRVEEQVDQARSTGFAEVVLDLRAVTFMDSTGLRLLLRLDAAARAEGFAFRIADEDGPVRRLLELTGLSERFARAA